MTAARALWLSLALMLALQSPEFEIIGVTTVMGNRSLERATADVLREGGCEDYFPKHVPGTLL